MSQLRVKFMAKGNRPGDEDRWLRQFPGREPSWGDCRFIFDAEATAYDWLVVYDDLAPVGTERFSSRIERLPCPRDHTLLVTAEPASVKTYGRSFCEQFGWVLTSQEPWALTHPRVVHGQTGYRWFYGMTDAGFVDFDALAAAEPPEKTGFASTICSSKAQRHTLHERRLEFTAQLTKAAPALERFGRGFRPIDDKREAIDPYRLHVAIENHVAKHHFTEKLADTFLGWAMPVYHGAPNTAEYFPPESLVSISLQEPDAVAAKLRELDATDAWAGARTAIAEARRRVLYEYNLFATLERFIRERHAPRFTAPGGATIKGRHRARIASPLTLIGHVLERRRVRRKLRQRDKDSSALH
ncbi:MAG: glycosyltransferase family 10 [Pseudomonadota bacterium]